MTIVTKFHVDPMNNVKGTTNMRTMQFLWLK